MHLLEDSPQGRMRRRNLILLLQSGGENWDLGLRLMEEGGMPKVAVLKVLQMHFPQSFGEGSLVLQERSGRIDQLMLRWLPPWMRESIENYLSLLDLRFGPRHAVFNDKRFFERQVEEGLSTWEEMSEWPETDPSWLEHSVLFQLLLENGVDLDWSWLGRVRLPSRLKRSKHVNDLVRKNPPGVDWEAFWAQFVTGNCLDLRQTGLREIPPTMRLLPQVEVLELWGANIKELPSSWFRQLRQLKCGRRQLRLLRRQACALEGPSSRIALEAHLHSAEIFRSRGMWVSALSKYEEASGLLDDPRSSQLECMSFGQGWFGTALAAGDGDYARRLLSRLFRHPRGGISVLGAKPWFHWGMDVYGTREWDTWNAFFREWEKELPQLNGILNQDNTEFWRYAWVRSSQCDGLTAGLAWLDHGEAACGDKVMKGINWGRLLPSLDQSGDWERIWKYWRTYQSEIFVAWQGEWQSKAHLGIPAAICNAAKGKGELGLVEAWCGLLLLQYRERLAAQRRAGYPQAGCHYARLAAMWACSQLERLYEQGNTACAAYMAGLSHQLEIQGR